MKMKKMMLLGGSAQLVAMNEQIHCACVSRQVARCCRSLGLAKARWHMTTKTQNSEARQTTDHDAIRKWVDERGGRPAPVKATEEDGHAGILRIDFAPPDKGLDRIGWDAFFEKFAEAGIAFLHQDRTSDGQLSRFHK